MAKKRNNKKSLADKIASLEKNSASTNIEKETKRKKDRKPLKPKNLKNTPSEVLNNSESSAKSRSIKSPKKKEKVGGKETLSRKNVTDMTREELIKSATSTAQHANKTIRDFEKANMGNFKTPGTLLSIAEKYDLKTKGNRISRSFKNLSDNQLRRFVIESKQTYKAENLKKAMKKLNKRRQTTQAMLLDRNYIDDLNKVNALTDEQFNELYRELSANASGDNGKKRGSDDIILEFLAKFGIKSEEDEEGDIAFAFQKGKDKSDRFNKHSVKNRNVGRRQ